MATREFKIEGLRLHPKQAAFYYDTKPITYCEAGTKSGKTFACMMWLLEKAVYGKAGNYLWLAPYKNVAKMAMDLYLEWFRLGNNSDILRKHNPINLSAKTITLANGAILWFKSGDNYHALYGEKYRAAIIDEGSRIKIEAFNAVITTLTVYDAPLKVIGNPGFVGEWFHDGCRAAERGESEYASYHHMTTFDARDAGIVKQKTIDKAMATMHPIDFERDYMGRPISFARRPFLANFKPDLHVSPVNFEKHDAVPLWLSFDFNVDPMTCIVAQHIEQGQGKAIIRVLKEFRAEESDIWELCKMIQPYIANHKAMTYVVGDQTGHARSAIAGKGVTYYTIIEQNLSPRGGLKVVRIKGGKNPEHSASRIVCNFVLATQDIMIAPACKYLIADMKLTEMDDFGDIDKQQEQRAKRGHLLDCIRYYLHKNFAHYVKTQLDVIQNLQQKGRAETRKARQGLPN